MCKEVGNGIHWNAVASWTKYLIQTIVNVSTIKGGAFKYYIISLGRAFSRFQKALGQKDDGGPGPKRRRRPLKPVQLFEGSNHFG